MPYLTEASSFNAGLLTMNFRVGLATPDSLRHVRKTNHVILGGALSHLVNQCTWKLRSTTGDQSIILM